MKPKLTAGTCIFAVTLALALAATPTFAKLAVGAAAPDFSAPAALAGKAFTFALADALKKGPVVVYFYPKAFTRGCTIEANLFAEATGEFAALGATVIGVSADGMEVLKEFSTGPCGGKFAVASDEDRKIIKAYDAALLVKPDMADRVSYVITPDHKILYVHDSLNPDQHVTKTLAAIKAWKQKTTN